VAAVAAADAMSSSVLAWGWSLQNVVLGVVLLFLLVPGKAGRRGRGGGIGDCGDAHAGGGEDNGKTVGGGER